LLAGCGGGGDDSLATSREDPARKSGSTGGTTTTVASILPTTAPAPGVLVYESFGLGNDYRPYGDKGVMRQYTASSTLHDYYVEWSGNTRARWMTPQGDQTWKFNASRDGYELPSPLENDSLVGKWGGASGARWTDGVTTIPTALLAFRPPAAPYTVSASAAPAPVAGTYVSIGLTASPVLESNFATVGQVWLSLIHGAVQEVTATYTQYYPPTYELRLNGKTGPLLATGTTTYGQQLSIRHDPVARTVSATVNGQLLGPFPAAIAPAYAGFEGVGGINTFVIRETP